ncbi:MAG: Gldg family protein [Hyphomicrobiaceae bacterium]
MSDHKPTMKETAARLSQRVTGWSLLAPGEAVQAANRLDRRTLAWGALALGAVLLLTFNLLTSLIFRSAKLDLTEDRLFTISNGTRSVLSRIEEPISVRVYYTKKLGEVAPLFGKYFERVKALLEQYRDISGGKLVLTFIDPDTSPDAEDRASSSGLKAVRLNQDGENGYFGLIASNTTDNDALVEFFTPERERYLEYDLTKLINGLSTAKKRVVGLISGLQMEGGQNPMQPMRQPSPPWMITEQIREFLELRSLDMNVKSIPADIDVLMLAQPMFLTADAAYAIDQYVLGGGRVLAFVDPHTETNPMGAQGMQLPMSPEVAKLLAAWGVKIDDSKVIGDPAIARSVQFGGRGGRGAQVSQYLAWLQIGKEYINEKDPLAASIEKLHLASAGTIVKVDGATTVVQPILESSHKAGFINTDMVRFQPNPIGILNAFQPANTGRHILAARISGDAKSAFPDGAPKPEEKPKDAAAPGAPEKSLQEKVEEKLKEAKEKEAAEKAKSEPARTHIATGKVNVVLIGDADMLHDQFWVEVRDFLGQQVPVPQAHNAAFVVNALEQLAGGAALSDLRGRGISERPFDRVVRLRRSAEQKFRQQEEGLALKLKDIQEKVSKMEARGGVAEGSGQPAIMLSEKDKQTIDTFKSEMIATRHELRNVKAALRTDIDNLDRRLRFINIAVVPLLIGLGGLALALTRRNRRQSNGPVG